MTVRILQPGRSEEAKDSVADLEDPERDVKTAPRQDSLRTLPKFDSNKLQLGLPLNSVLGAAQSRT
jgi:hypothetical protein